jgi:choline transport protein
VGWLSGTAALNFMAGTMMQSLAKLWHPNYSHEAWHSTLIIIGVALICTFLNTIAVKRLHFLELITLFVHFFGIFVVLFPLWILAPKASARQVFRTFEDNGGWGNIGIACLVAQIGPLFSLSRSDSGTHLCKSLMIL